MYDQLPSFVTFICPKVAVAELPVIVEEEPIVVEVVEEPVLKLAVEEPIVPAVVEEPVLKLAIEEPPAGMVTIRFKVSWQVLRKT